jgi:hypothetical protein
MSAEDHVERTREGSPGPAVVPGTARTRLEELLGRDFAQRLLDALAPDHGRRGSSSP